MAESLSLNCLRVHARYVASGRVSLTLLSVSGLADWVVAYGKTPYHPRYPVSASSSLLSHVTTSNICITSHLHSMAFASVHLSAAGSLSLLPVSTPTYIRQLHHHEVSLSVFLSEFLHEAVCIHVWKLENNEEARTCPHTQE